MANKYKYIFNTSRDFITLINKEYVYELVNKSYQKKSVNGYFSCRRTAL